MPGWCGCRLWLRTLDTAGAAARAHDADIIAIAGAGACLNYRDSACGVPARGLTFTDGEYLVFSPGFKTKMLVVASGDRRRKWPRQSKNGRTISGCWCVAPRPEKQEVRRRCGWRHEE